MALTPIDLDRGCIMRMAHARQLNVVMYEDSPGIYYAPNGALLDPDVAREAGFDVDADLRERDRLGRRSAALAAIDREFSIMPEGEVVADTGDFRVVHRGNGWFDILDGNDGVMNPARMRRTQADEFVEVLRKGKEHADGTSS